MLPSQAMLQRLQSRFPRVTFIIAGRSEMPGPQRLPEAMATRVVPALDADAINAAHRRYQRARLIAPQRR